MTFCGIVFNESMMFDELFNSNKELVLGSQSPRRRELIKSLQLPYRVEKIDCEEIYPSHLQGKEIPEYLAELKASQYLNLQTKEILITADTVVIFNNKLLEKPKNKEEAISYLTMLSGTTHQVITGVCMAYLDPVSVRRETVSFSSTTNVRFKVLSKAEILYYIQNFKPYDKAGAYGIQEWIGKIGVESIEGDFYNVMGLPLVQLFSQLQVISEKF